MPSIVSERRKHHVRFEYVYRAEKIILVALGVAFVATLLLWSPEVMANGPLVYTGAVRLPGSAAAIPTASAVTAAAPAPSAPSSTAEEPFPEAESPLNSNRFFRALAEPEAEPETEPEAEPEAEPTVAVNHQKTAYENTAAKRTNN